MRHPHHLNFQENQTCSQVCRILVAYIYIYLNFLDLNTKRQLLTFHIHSYNSFPQFFHSTCAIHGPKCPYSLSNICDVNIYVKGSVWREREGVVYSTPPPLHLPPPSIQTDPKIVLDKLVSSMIVYHILRHLNYS